MVQYVCKNCNFRFNSKDPFECPYCGREESFEKEKDAEGLLQEIEDLLKN